MFDLGPAWAWFFMLIMSLVGIASCIAGIGFLIFYLYENLQWIG